MNEMRRFGQVARLKPDKADEYESLHAAVWPEVLSIITACNLRNYSIFRQGELVFTYFEYIGLDFENDMRRMAADPVTQEWWKLTKPCFLGHVIDEYYMNMQEIFHCE